MPEHNDTQDHPPGSSPPRAPDGSNLTFDWSNSDPAARLRPATPGTLQTDRYRMVAEVARGGMGAIWRATDTALGREVAVKVLHQDFAPGSRVARRFADEARITAQLQHPAIPPVHDCGTLPDGRPFLAMKLIRGRTLDELLQRRPDPAAERGRFVAVFEQVCQAVAYAHAHQVIHRDLKPSNVMVGSFGEVQVMDWGLAKVLTATAGPVAPDAAHGERVDGTVVVLHPDDADLGETSGSTVIHGSDDDGSDPSFTQAGSVLGTPAYMAPEQAAGEVERVGPRSDVFGLGAILAVILTGRPPYAGANSGAVRLMAVRGDLAACLEALEGCGAEPELVALCRRCLAPDPAARPPAAGAVAEEVAGLRAAAEVRALAAEKERAAAEVRVAEQRKRRRLQRAVAAAVAVILAVVGGGAWWLDHLASLRKTELAVAIERDRQEATASLVRAEGALSADDLAGAELALTLAEKRLRAEAPADLATRLATAKRDRDLLRGLREIQDIDWSPGDFTSSEKGDIAKRYQAAFSRYGLDVAGASPEAAAGAVRASRVLTPLALGLSEWFCIDAGGTNLREVLDRLDADRDRATIRAAIQSRDEGRVRALVAALDGSKVPAWFAASVGFHPMVPPEDGVRLMAAAWWTYPSDYLLAARCSRRLWGTQRLEEMLGWARLAVSLRPDSAYANGRLTAAWSAMSRWNEAEAAARRVIELRRDHPQAASAFYGLANVLIDKGDFDGAEASYLAALAANPKNIYMIYHNLALVYHRRGDVLEAETWFRKSADATPASAPQREYYKSVPDQVTKERKRLEEVVDGRAEPANPDEALMAIRMALHPSRGRSARAVTLFTSMVAPVPALVDGLSNRHRYDAARCAVLAAAGEGKGRLGVEAGERSRLTGLAMTWLQTDLARMTTEAKDLERRRQVGQWLTRWKEDPDLAPVRNPAPLGSMPPADAEAWRALWRDVDALLDSVRQRGRSGSAGP